MKWYDLWIWCEGGGMLKKGNTMELCKETNHEMSRK
jgi:hypothetical protein